MRKGAGNAEIERCAHRRGIDPKRVLIIRHTPYNGGSAARKAKECLDMGMIREYTSTQKSRIARNASTGGRNLGMAFVADESGTTRLHGVYRHDGTFAPARMTALPDGFPAEAALAPEDTTYTLADTDVMGEYVNRLRIGWNGNGRTYLRKADTNDFPVEAIECDEQVRFPALPVFVCVMGEPWGIMVGREEDNRRCLTACTRV